MAKFIVKPRYRGTTTYLRVLQELSRAAEYRGLTTYQRIASIMGLPLSGSYMGSEVGHILGEISEDEVNAGRPMLSSVAVTIHDKVGEGFFGLAGRMDRTSNESDSDFVERERAATYKAWARPLHEPSASAAKKARKV